ncbi:hypothetical protein D5W64_13000 [Salmonella enterica subsp. enterica serovar Saintpaul]|nr:hypothetical protein [Salmonella enterica subsp. enterica serovar Saintpaul]
MTDNVMKDLKMAEISLARVPNVENMVKEATEVMEDFRVNVAIRDEVQQALDTVEQRADYELTVGIVNDVDQVINKHANVIVSDGTPLVAGTEAFGISLLPSEWRLVRTKALKDILAETYKNIKRWANQLAVNFESVWHELNTTIEVLEQRMNDTTGLLDRVSGKVDGVDTVEVSELISRSISKNGKMPGGDVGNVLKGEINYILLCLRAWAAEQVRFKGQIIRYFGNQRNVELAEVIRELPKVFDQRARLADTKDGMLIGRETRPMIGDKTFQGVTLDPKWIRDNIKSVANNTQYADALSYTGYTVTDLKANTTPGKVSMPVMSLGQLYQLTDLVQSIIDELKKLNTEDNPTNFNPDDVKDVLGTLKETNTSDERAYQYGLITADYQYDVNNFKSQATIMMSVLASHLITLVNTHAAAYNVE